jgi:hypothetical protein
MDGLPPQYSQKSSANERASRSTKTQEPFRPEKHSEEKEDETVREDNGIDDGNARRPAP